MAIEIRRDGGIGSAAAQGSGRREREAEAAPGGERDGRIDVEGTAGKKTRDARFAAGSRDLGDYETGLLAAAGQRACRLIGMDPNTWRSASRRRYDADARVRLRALAAERCRFSYLRLQILLDREGMTMNYKKLFRLYREEGGLSVRKRGGPK